LFTFLKLTSFIIKNNTHNKKNKINKFLFLCYRL